MFYGPFLFFYLFGLGAFLITFYIPLELLENYIDDKNLRIALLFWGLVLWPLVAAVAILYLIYIVSIGTYRAIKMVERNSDEIVNYSETKIDEMSNKIGRWMDE